MTSKHLKFAVAVLCAVLCAVILGTGLIAAPSVAAQNPSKAEMFKVHLSPVPIDATMLPIVAGVGSMTATLAGKTLTLTGTFEGLKSPATTANIRRAPKGLHGPVILDLSVTKAMKGTIGGSLELTPEQIADLKAGNLYVQIQSEGAPDGNLWGWLLH